MTNIKDVAQHAGVSVTTVSRVMNNRGYIGKGTRKKVEEAMMELNYSPNQIARALQKSQSYLLGVIVPDSNHPFFSELIKYIEMSADELNYKILICNSLDQPDKELHYVTMLRENRVDGIIMCSHSINIERYKTLSLPIVTFDRIISDKFPYVASDNFRGGEIATTHLIELGCKRLLHLSGPSNLDSLANRRADAFRLTCIKYNVDFDIIEGTNGNMTFEYFNEFIKEELALKLSNYDGVFCSNDIEAYALYVYAHEIGIKVPEQLKIVGYDYHSFTRMIQNPKLTTIKQPIHKLGKVLSYTLINFIENIDKDTVNNSVLDIELIKGDTT